MEKEVNEFLEKADGDPERMRVLIRFLVTFKVTSDDAEVRSYLKGLDRKFKLRNKSIPDDDEGLVIFVWKNRQDSNFALGHLVARLGPQDAVSYLEDIVPTLIWSFSDDINIHVRLSACKALSTIAGIVGSKLLDYFEPLFHALLQVYKKPKHKEPEMPINFRCLNQKLMNLVKENDNSRFMPLFKRHVNSCPQTLKFMLKWFSHLCNHELLSMLPNFLQDMFNMVSPSTKAFKRPRSKALVVLSQYRQAVACETYQDKSNVGEVLRIVKGQLAQKSTRTEALSWISMLITKYPGEVLHIAEFKNGLLAEGLPEAHYLEGIRIAYEDNNFKAARTHLFHALNHVKESTFVIAMFATHSGDKELADFFSAMLYTQPWGEVVNMWESVRTTITEVVSLVQNADSRTLAIEIPGCAAKAHSMASQCKDCYLYWCLSELSHLE